MEERDTVPREAETFLIGIIHETYYGIKTSVIKEIVELPALKSLPHFPSFFSGILDYRGTMIPVLDTSMTLGFESLPYSDTDVVVIIQEAGELFGIMIPTLFDIQSLQVIQETHFSQFIVAPQTTFPIIKAISKYQDNLIFLFDTQAILAELHALFSIGQKKNLQEKVAETALVGEALHDVSHYTTRFELGVPDHLKELFSERAKRVAGRFVATESMPGMVSITILTIQGKKFAIESEKIKEFCYISEYATIPSHQMLLGFMTLRGTILPLADIWYLLHGEKSTIKPLCKVMVVEVVDGVIGFVVEEANKVVSVEMSAFCDLPFDTATEEEPFIQQAVKVENAVIGILDTEKLIQVIYGNIE